MALEELYAHYRRTERMMDNLLRDETRCRPSSAFRRFPRLHRHRTRQLMAGRRRGRRRRRVLAATGHALAFATWRSLAREQGLDDPQAAELMVRLVAAAQPSMRPARGEPE